MVLSALVEGSSVNATARMCGVSKVTVLRLLADAGTYCADYHDLFVQGVRASFVEVDEIWSFCGCKDRTRDAGGSGFGSVWTWVAMDAETKLCISYLVGLRDGGYATHFIRDLAERLATRIQLTSDGHRPYADVVDDAFGGDVDYAMLIKTFAASRIDNARYSPPACTGSTRVKLCGDPDESRISTSYIERQNLTMRMSMRRFTRLTNGFSRRLENHAHAVALHYQWYNWIRTHHTIRTTPAVAAGLSEQPMTMLDLVEMIQSEEDRLGARLSDYLPSTKKRSGSMNQYPNET